MIQIPVHSPNGDEVASVSVDEQLLGGEVRPALLKQAFVRYHANRRQGSVRTKNRSETAYSTKKLFRQKGTGNARRGTAGTNIMRHGGMAFAKRPRSFRQAMPTKMRRLANRNALLAKAVDGEIKLVSEFAFDKPSTKQFAALLAALKIDRSCLVALPDTRHHAGRSARNLDHVSLTRVDQLNAFDLLNHRYVLVDRASFEQYLKQIQEAGE